MAGASLWEQGLPAMKFMRFPLEPKRLHREQALLPQINPLATNVQ